MFVVPDRTRFGLPLDYPAVDRLVRRLRARTGVRFTPHELRHTYATELLRRGVAVEVVQKLLGHASISTTIDTYSHLDIEDARRALVAAGVMEAVGCDGDDRRRPRGACRPWNGPMTG